MSENVALPAELKQVLEFMGTPEAQHEAVFAVYNAVEGPLRHAWEAQPQSARNIMDSFEQFQAVVAFTLVGPTAELLAMVEQNAEGEERNDEQANAMMEQLLQQGIKMMVKDLKSARRNASLRNEFQAPFKA
ncbi:conserved hypothetical protein [Ferrimonas balearica DSM 9799]|uniref:Uncharacterized protein n=1 Tax=Ferrimonas balearica (strain DSM 9799 / CCM 4581 / KCTC 23876 / PAT) TaxID=550540 RepID=E1SSL2_FERBD|nr:DUF3069 domain-containing protein [Ferrimonas balearica]MBY6016526.1 DUF3069 domain-containing protein [Halomonas denitrificans]ADN76041.1 conserved hypothetical protein [Ferrimonas balearica DSM 9799]MBW3138950.1 DUF3069 domain-containing protein [Ferrimonas balearica]MBW3163458.1 DUF3069 domain-containing protein [Ferrimonas balearica]MBY5979733.1 DUF3069 domain-containing protein [Ferrimonas balearica]